MIFQLVVFWAPSVWDKKIIPSFIDQILNPNELVRKSGPEIKGVPSGLAITNRASAGYMPTLISVFYPKSC
jgi:hypothetical protein